MTRQKNNSPDAAWEALAEEVSFEPGMSYLADTVARHRPVIEAAVRKAPDAATAELVSVLEAQEVWWRCNCHDTLLSECPNRDRIAAALTPQADAVMREIAEAER